MSDPKGTANYKGVMLCNRPSFDANIIKEKPFVSRVDKKEMLGINPVQRYPVSRPRKYVNTAILKHKLWLEEFKKKVKEEKLNPEYRSHKSTRSLKKSDSLSFEHQKQEIEKYFGESEEKGLTSEEKKQTEKIEESEQKPEQEPKDDQECQSLIDFMSNLNYDEFIQDMEVKSIINTLKQKIAEKKEKKSQVTFEKPQKEEKTNKNPLPAEGWDKTLKNNLQSADTETRLTKYIANEILRNEKILAKIHSNASVRKILEMEKPKEEKKG